jgi:hypothetical protein
MHTLQQLRSGELVGTTHLKLSCGLTEFPPEIFSLAESLEVLDLSANQLSALPADFGRLSKLKIAFFSDNLFTELPAVLADCKQLDMIGFKSNQINYIPENALPEITRWLILTNNKLRELPHAIGNCLRLQKVALAGNLLTELPVEMAACRNLELLRISANRLTELPAWLLQLSKLAWLAFAGNPFRNTVQPMHEPEQLNWQEFELLEQLGEGASGNIYRALWQNNTREVAIKVFKGEVTSDGFPADEMRACIAAGKHPGLVGLLGKLKDHPQQKQGLVMELIPPAFYNLGMPPSFVTCSRDTFADGTEFSVPEILKIAMSTASAAAHLHAIGLMHGDLYAHNILIDNAAHSLMGDYGAASFYELNNVQAKNIQRIEVRAYGCLLDDLLMHLTPGDQRLKMIETLQKIRTNCMQEDIGKRPLFEEILEILRNI